MASNLFYKEKPIFGLDFNQTSLKVMSIDSKEWVVNSYGSTELSPAKVQAIFDGTITDTSYLSDNIKLLMKNNLYGELPSNHVAIGIPTGRTFSRTFTIPVSQAKYLKQAVDLEVSQYIPVPAESLYTSHSVLSRDKDKLEIVLVAAPKSLVDACVKSTIHAGFRPIAVEPNINAAARILEYAEDAHLSSLIIDIGQATTDIAVFDKSAIRASNSASVGGNTFTLDIASGLGVSLENAHQLKIINGLSAGPKQSQIQKAISPSLKKICHEVRRTIRFYSERVVNASKIEQVLVIGAGSSVPGIGDFFTSELLMPARVASPWLNFNFGKLKAPHRQYRPRFISVAGLSSLSQKVLWQQND